jgi:hypothetical protein
MSISSQRGEAYATVTSDDVDDNELARFNLEAVMPPGGTRRLRGLQVNNFIDVDAFEHLTIDDDHRSLQGGCSSFDVIEMAIVVDSSLCTKYGGEDNVSTLSQSIVAAASKYYEVPGLGKKLEISYLEIHCNPATDPIQPFLSLAGTNAVCAESNGLLRSFGGFNGYVKKTGIGADVVHLFHGKDFTGTGTIGCTYIGTL